MTPREFLDSQPKSSSPICELPPAAEDAADGLLTARASSDFCDDTISGPRTGTCGNWCWAVDLENRNVSCTDICVSKDIGGPAVKVFVTGHDKLVNFENPKYFSFFDALVTVVTKVNMRSNWRNLDCKFSR